MAEAQSKMRDVDKAIANALKPSKQNILDLEAALGLLKLEHERGEAKVKELQEEVGRLQAALAEKDEKAGEVAHAQVQTDVGAEFFDAGAITKHGRAKHGMSNDLSPSD